jgi:chromosome segregation ATPase
VTDNDSDKWVTVSEAAEVLGVSERTIWRRVKAQRLEIDRSVSPHVVRVSDTVTDKSVTESDTVSEVSELEGEVERLSRDVQALEAEVERLSDVLAEVRSERDYLRQAHAAALSTSQRLLEHVEAVEVEEEGEPEPGRGLLGRVARWFGGGW